MKRDESMSVTGYSLPGNQYEALTTDWAEDELRRREKQKVMETRSDMGFVEDIVEFLCET